MHIPGKLLKNHCLFTDETLSSFEFIPNEAIVDPQTSRIFRSRDLKEFKGAPFDERMQKAYGSSVLYIGDEDVTINLASLHRVVLQDIQKSLVEKAIGFKYEKQPSGDWDFLQDRMHQYGKFKRINLLPPFTAGPTENHNS